MKKLLIVNSFYSPTIIGGAEISTQLLAESMTTHFEVHVLTSGPYNKKIVEETINEVRVHRIPCNNVYWPGDKNKKRNNFLKLIWHGINTNNPIQKRLLEKFLKDISPDLIHTQNLSGIGTYIWGIANSLSIPIVHTVRDYNLFEPVNNNKINRIIASKNRKRSNHVLSAVGISKFIGMKHRDNGFFKYASSHTIHNIVDSPVYSKKIIENNKPLNIGYFGQLEENKGIDTLLNAIHELPSHIIGKLIVCGSGSQLESLREEWTAKDKRISFLGKVNHSTVQKNMSEVDLTVVPSKWDEPFGRVIIESYRQSTPVLASEVGGIPEIIYDSKYLFEKGKKSALKEKLKSFFDYDDKARKEEAEKAFQASEKYLDNTQDYLEVYGKLIDCRRNSI